MASTSYPHPAHNGGAVTDLEYERLVQAQAPDGMFGSPAGPPLVYANGVGDRTVYVRAGRSALIRGFMYESGDTDIPVQLAPNTSGKTRFDRVVLRLDRTTWSVREAVVQGVPGQPPPAYAQGSGPTGVWEFPAVTVTVIDGATNLAPDTITQNGWYLSDDGAVILCNLETRPPGAPGRIIHQVDADAWLGSPGVGEVWQILYENTEPVPLTPATGWSTNPTGFASVQRRNGVVHLKFDLFRIGGAIPALSAVPLLTLTPDMRPVGTDQFAAASAFAVGGSGRFSVNASGAVLYTPTFNHGAGVAVSGSTTWPV